MILIRNIVLIFMGLACAMAVASGIFAFITMLGIVPRLASRTGTSKYIILYENMIITGGMIGNIIDIFNLRIFIGFLGLLIFGVFAGIFVGCLAMALAEMLQVIPIFISRAKIRKGLPIIVGAIAIGKFFGGLLGLVV